MPIEPNYQMIDGSYMRYEGFRLHTETQCDGCGGPYTWSHDAKVAIIVDRSGSEQAVTHRSWACIQAAIENLNLDPYS